MTIFSRKKQPVEDTEVSDQTTPEEESGGRTPEVEAAEQDPTTAEVTNPVGEATQHESKDPYAEGKHIANPEPNNGAGHADEMAADEAEEQADRDQMADDMFNDQKALK